MSRDYFSPESPQFPQKSGGKDDGRREKNNWKREGKNITM